MDRNFSFAFRYYDLTFRICVRFEFSAGSQSSDSVFVFPPNRNLALLAFLPLSCLFLK